MKRTDTIELVLKGKTSNRVLAVTPDHSVYDAIEKMAGGVLGIVAGRVILYFEQASHWVKN